MAQAQAQPSQLSNNNNTSFVGANFSYGPTGPFMPAPYTSYGLPLQQQPFQQQTSYAPITMAARPETVSTIFPQQSGILQQQQPIFIGQPQPMQGQTIVTGSAAPIQSQPGQFGFIAGQPSDWQFGQNSNSMFRSQPLLPFFDPMTRTPMYATSKDTEYEKIDNNSFYLRVDPNVRGGATNSATGTRAEGFVTPDGEYVYTYNRPVVAEGPVPVTRHPFARDQDPHRGLVEYYVEGRGGRKNNNNNNNNNNTSKYRQLFGDLCPDCGDSSFIFEEGCKKCYSCGYSEC